MLFKTEMRFVEEICLSHEAVAAVAAGGSGNSTEHGAGGGDSSPHGGEVGSPMINLNPTYSLSKLFYDYFLIAIAEASSLSGKISLILCKK